MAKTKRSSSSKKDKEQSGDGVAAAAKAEKKAKRESIGGISKKGKRKERKQKFLERLKEAQDHLALGASNEDVLASVRQIGESLPDLKTRAAAPKRSKPLTNKSRQKLFTTEVAQFANVLQHPNFNEDPLSAIRAHLENTIDTAPLAEEAEAASDEETSGASAAPPPPLTHTRPCLTYTCVGSLTRTCAAGRGRTDPVAAG
jgi:hypothetical protein